MLKPATHNDAPWMLAAALQEHDPVFIFEHALLYPTEGEVDDTAGPADITKAAIRRAGKDVSLIKFAGSLFKSLDAAEQLGKEGIEAEVIDLRVLRPLDTTTELASVSRTHRAVIIDEAWRTGSFAAEISAQIMDNAFDELDAPVARVCSAEVPMHYPKHLDTAALPQTDKIFQTVRSLCNG